MKKKERQKKKQQALKLFLEGDSNQVIANKLNTSTKTIVKWKKAENWETKRLLVTEKAKENILWDREKELERMMKLINATEAKYAQELQNSTEIPQSASRMAQMMKIKQDLLIPKTISQYNFMKTENNSITNEGIKFIIEDRLKQENEGN